MPSVSTSRAALHSVSTPHLELEVLRVIESFGARGCISDEVREQFPNLAYSSVTARYAALEKKKLIVRSGRRPGDSGRQQAVMFAATVAPATAFTASAVPEVA